jgi:hypothetical protein
MAVHWNERWRQRELDERIYRAIKTRDWGTALTELFKEVRQVRICEHGNLTDYEECPQCESYLDEMMRAPEVEDE